MLTIPWFEGSLYDLRFALRGLRRDRGFAATAIVMLALAIGLNVTVFAVMNTMLFRGFPLVKRNDRLLYMQEKDARGCCLSYPDFEEWRTEAKSFEAIALVSGKQITLSDGPGDREMETSAVTVTTNLFGLLGVAPSLGRDFAADDEAPGAAPVAILSNDFWVSRFGKRGDIIGRIVYINKAPVKVIAVMPAGFAFPNRENLWLPLEHTPSLLQRVPALYMAVGRLAAGATVQSSQAEIETIGRRLASAYPATNRDVVPRVDTHAQFFMGPDAPVVYGSLWAAAWFVLLIACANLANLTLARTLGRSREFSTRIAIGAGQWRMLRQILVESLLLAGAGGFLGWWLTKWSVGAWAAATESRYQVLDYSLDFGTVLYLVAVSIAAAFLFAVLPAVRVFRLDVNGTLKSDSRGATQGLRAKYISAALVTLQMALAIVLLSGAGVLARSFWKVVGAESGVAVPEKVLTGWVHLPPEKYASPESRLRFFGLLKSRLLAIPGVEAESVASILPVGNERAVPFDLEDQPTERTQTVQPIATGPDYFRTVGAITVTGRDFDDSDVPGGEPVAIINQSFAARYWAGQNPLGKRLRLYGGDLKPRAWRTVVGVVSNIMQGDPTRQRFLPLVYVPFQAARAPAFLVRTRVAADQLAAAVRAEVEKLDPDLTLEDFSTLKASFAFRADRMDIEHVEMGKHAGVAPIFAGIALLLAAIGLYAVVAHSVGRRTKEIGVRMALGAALSDVRLLVFREGMLPVAVGLMVGLTASLGVNRILQSQLVGVSPYDPVTIGGSAVLLIAVALVGCQIPARRAMRVDPAVALRHD